MMEKGRGGDDEYTLLSVIFVSDQVTSVTDYWTINACATLRGTRRL
jgi:hypothetical protein